MVLPITNCEKDLGINFVSELKWNYYIEQNISKAKKCIGWVTRSVISREADVMINIYKSLVLWGLCSSHVLNCCCLI